ncbi:MAG TPA: chloride channel protein [Planctomycetota bacterium]|nr:chloride channel protein [Planctomycetota bacterium]
MAQRETDAPGSLTGDLVRSALVVIAVGAAVGSACAFFLWSLERVTGLRWEHPWLLDALPLAGLVVGALYQAFGARAEAGNDLLMDEIHEPGAGIPKRMAPLVLLGTLLTHLCGGSAGREGTAVQMGGSIASFAARRVAGWSRLEARTLLLAGIAAGFGGVFGTPLAGALFAMEVPAIGALSWAGAVPCLLASVAADLACSAWGIRHTPYRALLGAAEEGGHAFSWTLLAKIALAGVACGLASRGFSALAHGLQRAFRAAIRWPWLRPVAGGLAVIALVALVGSRDFLGLGVSAPDPGAVTIESAFREGGAHAWSWLWKMLFTAVTLGSGFKGGEVTPLFYIGATFGHVLAGLLAAPVTLLAATGLVAVFAGATNTPLACTLMAVELFGPGDTLFFATACLLAYVCSGHSGIYARQRGGARKPLRRFWPGAAP